MSTVAMNRDIFIALIINRNEEWRTISNNENLVSDMFSSNLYKLYFRSSREQSEEVRILFGDIAIIIPSHFLEN